MSWRGRDFWLAMLAGIVTASGAVLAVTASGASTATLIAVSALAQYFGHLAALIWLGRTRGGLGSLGLDVRPADLRFMFLGVLLQLTVPLIFYPLANLVSEGEGGQVVSDQLRQLDTLGVRVLMAGVVVLLAPITEELLFRGVLQRSLGRGRGSIFVTALFFAVFHVFGLSGDVIRSLALTMPTFLVVGLVLSYVTSKQQRLGPAILIHSGFNLIALLVFFLPPELLEQAVGQS